MNPGNFENTNNFESWGLSLVAHKKVYWSYFNNMINLASSSQLYIFLLLYVLRQKFTYRFLARWEISHEKTLCQQKMCTWLVYLIGICDFGINMNQTIVCISQWAHDINWSDYKMCTQICQSVGSKYVSQAKQFTS